MEARLIRTAILAAALVSLGASYRTQNFIVSAPTQEFAQQVGQTAEQMRRDLALEWLGDELPPWQGPCPITVHVGPNLGAGGATSFMFDGGRPFGWTMSIQGSAARILDSVLPHEITHTIFATHFGRPLPRWADEGACTTVEHVSEKTKQQQLLINFLTTGRGIAFNRMFALKEYPPDVLPLYAQGYSLARYLISQGGKRKFIAYVGDGMRSNNWSHTTQQHYGYKDLSELQLTWVAWVEKGSPQMQPDTTMIASATGAEIEAGAREPIQVAAAETVHAGGSPKAGPPITLASTASRTGWYARVRDETQTTRPGDAQNPRGRATTRTSAEQRQAVSRPQPISRPEQVVLEWSRPQGAPPPATTSSATKGAPPQHYLAPRPTGTMWR